MSQIRSVSQSCCIREYPRFGATGDLFVTTCVKSTRMFRQRYRPGVTCAQMMQPSGS